MQNLTLENHKPSTISENAELVNRIATSEQQAEFLDKADSLPRIQLDKRATSDLEMIAIGGFSPLQGFLEQADYESVVENMRLADGQPWSIPVTLSVDEEVAADGDGGDAVHRLLQHEVIGRQAAVAQRRQQHVPPNRSAAGG